MMKYIVNKTKMPGKDETRGHPISSTLFGKGGLFAHTIGYHDLTRNNVALANLVLVSN